MADHCGRGRANRRGKSGRKDEAGRVATNRVDQIAASGDVTAEAPERLGESSLGHIDPMHRAVARRNAGAAGTIHPDGLDLIAIGHSAVAGSQVADLPDRRKIAIHGIQAFEDDQLGPPGFCCKQALEIGNVVVPPDLPVTPECLIPSIIELWFISSDRMRQSRISLAIVEIPAWFET
jgi:hypothetical protein